MSLQAKSFALQEHLPEEQSALDHLKDGLWGWEDLCGRWFQQSIHLLCSTHFAEDPAVDAAELIWTWTLMCWRELVTFCPVLAEQMPLQFGDFLDVDTLG